MFKIYKEFLSQIEEIEFIDTDIKKITPWMIDILFNKNKVREEAINHLAKNNIGTRIFYPPIHSLAPYKSNDKKFMITTDISKRGLWMPSSNTLTDNELEYVCKKIKEFLMN
jgi:dTDP-4-amino-4,6-dideoxygalactose transaminase